MTCTMRIKCEREILAADVRKGDRFRLSKEKKTSWGREHLATKDSEPSIFSTSAWTSMIQIESDGCVGRLIMFHKDEQVLLLERDEA